MMENYLWFFSTTAQVFAAIWAVTGMFAVFSLELLDRKIKDALLTLLNFISARFRMNMTHSITRKDIEGLNNIKQYIVSQIEDAEKKHYFDLDPEVLLNRVKETKYIIQKYDDHFEKESENIEKQKIERKELSQDEEENQVTKENIIRRYQMLRNVYYTECDYKDNLIRDLTRITVLDGSIMGVCLFILFYLGKAPSLRLLLSGIQTLVLLFSFLAIILSGRFIWLYCRRRYTD